MFTKPAYIVAVVATLASAGVHAQIQDEGAVPGASPYAVGFAPLRVETGGAIEVHGRIRGGGTPYDAVVRYRVYLSASGVWTESAHLVAQFGAPWNYARTPEVQERFDLPDNVRPGFYHVLVVVNDDRVAEAAELLEVVGTAMVNPQLQPVVVHGCRCAMPQPAGRADMGLLLGMGAIVVLRARRRRSRRIAKG